MRTDIEYTNNQKVMVRVWVELESWSRTHKYESVPFENSGDIECDLEPTCEREGHWESPGVKKII